MLSPGFGMAARRDGAIVAARETSERCNYPVMRGNEALPLPRRGEGAENTNTDCLIDHRVVALAPIRVVVCDDHDLFRRGVAEMLSVSGGVEVVGEAATHEGAVAAVIEGRPDVVLLDLEMPGAGADDSMGRMLALSPPPGVVVLTMHDEPGVVRRFLKRGAAAYLAKSALTDELVQAVRSAARTAPGLETVGDEGEHE